MGDKRVEDEKGIETGSDQGGEGYQLGATSKLLLVQRPHPFILPRMPIHCRSTTHPHSPASVLVRARAPKNSTMTPILRIRGESRSLWVHRAL